MRSLGTGCKAAKPKATVLVVSTLLWCNGLPFKAQGEVHLLQTPEWRFRVDFARSCLAIEHCTLGLLADHVQFTARTSIGLQALQGWTLATNGLGQWQIKTENPVTTWVLEPATSNFSISSTLSSAALTGFCPVSQSRRVARLLDANGSPVVWQGTGEVAGTYGGKRTRHSSFLPQRNPDCMYFALGSVAASVFHELFDQASDMAIQFPKETLFELRGEQSSGVYFTMPVPGTATVRLVPDYYTKHLGVPYYTPFDDSRFPRAPMVWCSWTSYYGDVTEEAVIKNTDWLAEQLKPYGFQYVQIDDGYDRGPAQGHYWIEHWDKQKFPQGPEWIAQYIKSKGLHAGLWLVPNAFAGAVETHPDWYLRDREGKIVKDYDTPALDSSNPEVVGFLQQLFTTLKTWGFDYYKFDGEHALPKYAPPVDLSRLHDQATDPLEVYRHRLDSIRQVVGPDTFIEGCPAGTPLNGIGYFNSYFNGQDVYNNWHGMYSLFSSINANAFLNHVVVYVMPGEGMELGERLTVEEARLRRPGEVVETARSREEPMIGFGVTDAEARTLVSLVSLSGVVYPLAGVMPELPPARLRLLQRTMPTMPILPLDLFSRGGDTEWNTFKHVRADDFIHHFPEILDLKVNADSGVYDVVAVPNWRNPRVTKRVLLQDHLGLPGDRKYIAFDFWNQKLLGAFSNELTVEVESHDTRVLSLHPLLDHPQLVGTSRHITGAFSLRELSWDEHHKVLQGKAETVPGEDYTLFVHMPSGTRSPKASATTLDGDLRVGQQRKDELLSVTFNSRQSPVSWQIRF